MVDAHAANDEVLRSLEVHRLGPVPAVNFVRVTDGISNHGALETIVVFLTVGFSNDILFSWIGNVLAFGAGGKPNRSCHWSP